MNCRLPAGSVDELSFGSRGRQLAVGSGGATVDVWELRGLPSFVTSLDLGTTSQAVSFSPRGDTLAVGTLEGDVRLWDSRGWRPLDSPGRLPDAVSDLAFSANGRALAIATNDSEVRLWSTREVEWLREPLLGHIGSVAAVSFAPSGLGLASAGRDGNLIMWDPNRSDRLAQILPAKTARGYARMAFDPVTGRLAWDTDRGGLLLGDLAGGRPLELLSPSRTTRTFGVSSPNRTISSLEFSPDGKLLAAAIGKGDPVESSVQFWSAETGNRVQTPLRAPARSVSFSPDGRTLVAGGGEDQLHFVDIVAGDREVVRLKGLQGRDAEFSPNGQTLAAPFGLEGEVALVDAATLEEVATIETGEAAFVSDVAFSPDGADPCRGRRRRQRRALGRGEPRPAWPPAHDGHHYRARRPRVQPGRHPACFQRWLRANAPVGRRLAPVARPLLGRSRPGLQRRRRTAGGHLARSRCRAARL